MRSPFPGMDPYLEDPGGWTGVHNGLIDRVRTQLNQLLNPDFVADAGTTVHVVAADEQRWVFPDIYVAEVRRREASTGAARLAAPVEVLLDLPETVSQPHILIRDRASRRVVTMIEVLSPINKAPATTKARQGFLTKREETMASGTNWVEIDLLRAGDRPPEVRSIAPSPYYVLVRRAGEARAGIWPSGLRDELPAIGIPLRPDVPDIELVLQPLLDRLYAEGRYADLIDYEQPPPPPALTADDARWARERVEGWLAARASNGTNRA